MADSEHILHLVAKLDTSEVQQQIDKLNSGKLQSAQGTAPAKGVAGSSAIGDVAAVAIASQLNKMRSQFQSFTTSMIGFSKNMSSVSSSLAKFNNQLPDLVKRMRVQYDSLHKLNLFPPSVYSKKPIDASFEVSNATSKQHDAAKLEKVPSINERLRKFFEKPGQPPTSLAYVSDMNKARASAEAGARAEAIPLYQNQLIRWGGAAFGSQVLIGAGKYLEASRSPYAGVVTAGGMMLQGAAMGAAAGATLGPQGAAIGAMLGTAIAATNKLFDTWAQRAMEAQEEISNALKVDPNRRANISAAADMLRGLSQERELKMLSGMGTSSLDAVIERAAGKIKGIEGKIDSNEYDSAQELQTLLSQRQWQQRLKQAAEARRQQIENAREESTQRNIEEQDRREDIRESLKNQLKIASFGKMTGEDAKSQLEEARSGISRIESGILNGDYSSSEMQQMLNERSMLQQQAAAAQQRLQQIKAERLRLQGLKETASGQGTQIALGEISRYNVQKLQAMQADQDVDRGWLNAGYKAHGAEAMRARRQMKEALRAAESAKTSDEAQGLLARAEEARQRWTFSLGQQDFFKSGLVQTLQQQLASIRPADLSPVTSLGQYGYGMGEVNDNIDRQMQIWEEQTALQRQIKDILQDKTFEAYYAD